MPHLDQESYDELCAMAEVVRADGWIIRHAMVLTAGRMEENAQALREELAAADADPQVLAAMVGMFNTYGARRAAAEMAEQEAAKYRRVIKALDRATNKMDEDDDA